MNRNENNQGESIEPKAASDIICQIIQNWFGDGEDHYVSIFFINFFFFCFTCRFIFVPQICLVDKNSGAYFWYNTKDESTQWADTTA